MTNFFLFIKLCFECIYNCTDWEGGSGGALAGNIFFEADESMYSAQAGSSSATDGLLTETLQHREPCLIRSSVFVL